jgi:hypothetical protein
MTTGKGLPRSLANNTDFSSVFNVVDGKLVITTNDLLVKELDVSGNPTWYEVEVSAGQLLLVEVSAPV